MDEMRLKLEAEAEHNRRRFIRRKFHHITAADEWHAEWCAMFHMMSTTIYFLAYMRGYDHGRKDQKTEDRQKKKQTKGAKSNGK